MNRSETINELAQALSAAQGEFGPARMDKINPFLRNTYADLGSVIAAAKSACAKYGLAVSQPASTDGHEVTITTLLMHQSGQWLSDSMSLTLGEEKGRSIAQAAGSIITYLRRYSLSAMLGIYADEDTDGNGDNKTEKKPNRTTTAEPIPPTTSRQALFETTPEPDPTAAVHTWTEDEIYAAMVECGAAPNQFSASGALGKCTTGWNTPAKAEAWLKVYRIWREQKLTPDEAAVKANLGEVPAN